MVMATKLMQPMITARRGVFPGRRRTTRSLKSHKVITFSNLNCKRRNFDENPFSFRPILIRRVAEQSSQLVPEEEEEEEEKSVSQIKEELYQAVQGINRGIFGIPSAKKSEIERLLKLLERRNPMPEATGNLEKVGGCWRLVYSTITILGAKRTKLGLRDFISLGEFLQHIDVAKGKSVNVIKFNVRGLNLFNGQLRIIASFKIASKSRVDIKYESSTIVPDQLMNMFRKNYDLLLGIFNPEGWLEISYLDEDLRIGRDDKGNIFVLERTEEP